MIKENMERQDLPRSAGKVLIAWHGPEHVHVHPNPRSVLIALALLIVIVAYAVFSNNPIMAITFILIGFVGYLFLTLDPRTRDFAITTRGVLVGRELFAYEDIDSFWLFEDAPLENVLSLRSKAFLSPYIHIPLAEDHVRDVYAAVATYLPEEKQEPRAVDFIEKMLHH